MDACELVRGWRAKRFGNLVSQRYTGRSNLFACVRAKSVDFGAHGQIVTMIEEHDVIPLLLAASPSFELAWQEHRREYGDDLLYLALGEFARHLLSLHRCGQTHDFPVVAQAIERLHLEGPPSVREAATIGLLEGIQNNWSNDGVDPEQFAIHLLPESAKWWRSLNDFWSGKSKFFGEGL